MEKEFRKESQRFSSCRTVCRVALVPIALIFSLASLAACASAPRGARVERIDSGTAYNLARRDLIQQEIQRAERERRIPPQSWGEGFRRAGEDLATLPQRTGFRTDANGNHEFVLPGTLHVKQQDGSTELARGLTSRVSVSVTQKNEKPNKFKPKVGVRYQSNWQEQDGTDENGQTLFKNNSYNYQSPNY